MLVKLDEIKVTELVLFSRCEDVTQVYEAPTQ